MAILIPDLYEGDPTPDFSAMHRAGMRVVILKALEGVHRSDSQWESRATAATAAGLEVAPYHFVHVTDDPHLSALMLVSKAARPRIPILMPPIVDLEPPGDHGKSAGYLQSWLAQYAATLKAHGHTGGVLYSFTAFFRSNFGDPKTLDPFWRGWLADYGVKRPDVPRWMLHNGLWAWQFTSTGLYPGAHRRGDLSVTSLTIDQLREHHPRPHHRLAPSQWRWLRRVWIPGHFRRPMWDRAWQELTSRPEQASAIFHRDH